jgi:hypothetical protein
MINDIYINLINNFKSRFSEKELDETNDDINLLKKIIINKIDKIKKPEELCRDIISSHQYCPAHTVVRLGQIALLIDPTTVSCERGFSLMNNVKNKKRNRIKNTLLNHLLFIKSNLDADIEEEILANTSKSIVSSLKPEKYMNNIIIKEEKEKNIFNKTKKQKPVLFDEEEDSEESALHLMQYDESLFKNKIKRKRETKFSSKKKSQKIISPNPDY